MMIVDINFISHFAFLFCFYLYLQGRQNQGGRRGHVPPVTGEGVQAIYLYPPSWKVRIFFA